MNFIVRQSDEIKWKVEVVLLEEALMNFILRIWSKEGESGVPGSSIDEIHAGDIQGDQMEGESGVTGNIIVELDS